MRTTLTTAPGRHDHPPQPISTQLRSGRRVGPLDRLALHIGVALITWGRRPRAYSSFERSATRIEVRLARLARERAWERSARLTLPPR
ncbi:MAG: hypothetical protein H7226_07815 [Salinibacterium sp.]|nr:hypothetical protein [Salinibacterium sp.]